MAKKEKAAQFDKTTLRLPAELLAAAKHRAIDEGITFQTLAERAIERYLKAGRSEKS